MKKSIFLTLAALLSYSLAFSQRADHVNGSSFTKTVTYNTESYTDHHYVLEDKDVLDKMFFGFTNSPVEYTVGSVKAQGGLRLYKERFDTRWKLEVIPIANYWEQMDDIEREITGIKLPYAYLTWLNNDFRTNRLVEYEEWRDIMAKIYKDVPSTVLQKLHEQNGQAYAAERDEKTYLSRRPDTYIFVVPRLGEVLYDKMVALIGGFRAEGRQGYIDDGYLATFRCVVGAELWSLRIHCPENRAEQMSDLCIRIIRDAMESGVFDEQKYIAELEAIEF